MGNSPEQIFAGAKTTYEFVIENLREIYDQLNEKERKEAFDGSFKNMEMGFDLVLQNTLLKIATVDGDVSPNEAVFLSRLGGLGFDLCEYVKAFAKAAGEKVEVSWGAFTTSPIPTVRGFTKMIDAAIAPIVDKLYGVFSMVDMLSKKDYFTILEDGVLKISDAFLSIDFDRSEYENNAAIAEIKENILRPIVDNNIALMIALGEAKDEAEAKTKQKEKKKTAKKARKR